MTTVSNVWRPESNDSVPWGRDPDGKVPLPIADPAGFVSVEPRYAVNLTPLGDSTLPGPWLSLVAKVRLMPVSGRSKSMRNGFRNGSLSNK